MEILLLLTFPILAALLLAVLAAPLGVFVVWQRQSYFGATIAHAALLGVSVALLLNTQLTPTVISVSVLIALAIFVLSRHTHLSNDTLLGILAHSTLALGIAVISLQDQVQIDIMSYLFGDLLNVETHDIYWLLGCLGLVTLFFKRHWRDLLNITFNPELAHVEGTAVKRVQLQFIVLLAVVIAMAMKIVGVLLITSLLIIPAAAARPLSKTPTQMLWRSMLIGVLSVLLGVYGSVSFDIPTGASIVLASSILFMLAHLKRP